MSRTWPTVTAAIATFALAASPATAASEGHSHGDSGGGGGHHAGRPVGVLIVDHGEPPRYNADTYESFRAFIDHLMEMEIIPSWLRAVDGGTVLQDRGCYGCQEPRGSAELIDAWLAPHAGPAAWVPRTSESLPAHYLEPAGPGLGEPDIFEHAGLQVWNEWELMGGTSPNYAQKLAKKRVVIRELKRRYGRRIALAVGYGIDPRIDGGRQDIHTAVHKLMEQQVSRIVVVYHGVGFSDVMQTHMIRHEIEHTLHSHGAHIPLHYAKPLGASGAYVRSVVDKVRSELGRVPRDAPVAIHLSGHGLPTSDCGGYACGDDAYHAHAHALFERTKRALEKAIRRPGQTGVFHLYGDGATDADDPEEKVNSPIEALAARQAAGFKYVIDVPDEFDSDSRDTLIVLRQGYERPIPDWDRTYVSRFEHGGMQVRITNASFGKRLKTLALRDVAVRAIEASRADG